MRHQLFDAFDFITILSFLKSFKTSCDIDGISEGAAMWLINYFMKNP